MRKTTPTVLLIIREHYVIFNIPNRKILLPPKAAEKHRVSPNFLLLFFSVSLGGFGDSRWKRSFKNT